MKLVAAIFRLAAIGLVAVPLALIGLMLVVAGGTLVGLANIVKDSA